MEIIKAADRTIYYVGLEGAQLRLSIVEHYGSKFSVEMVTGFEDPKITKPYWMPLILDAVISLTDRSYLFKLASDIHAGMCNYNKGVIANHTKYLESKEACISWITEFDVYLRETAKYPIYH